MGALGLTDASFENPLLFDLWDSRGPERDYFGWFDKKLETKKKKKKFVKVPIVNSVLHLLL